jgi:hypothetical protein
MSCHFKTAKKPQKPVANMKSDHFMEKIAEEYDAENTAIHIMGELTFTYNFVNASNIHDFTCYAATSERNSVMNVDGTKTIQFDFVQFRRY